MRGAMLLAGIGLLGLLATRAAPAAAPPPGGPDEQNVFVSGKDGYHTYRIPSLLVSAKGTLLAFCEGRKQGRGDSGDIDLVLKRSFDNGRTWGPMQVVADDGPNTMGNPCPVLDRRTGTIWLPLTRNLGEDHEAEIKRRTSKGTREVWITRSTDDGATWAEPMQITRTAKRDDWTWYATGPGCGIQTRTGRLIIPCDHAVANTRLYRSHVIYSDSGGATWQIGGVIGDQVNECQLAELSSGALVINMRSYRGKGCREVAVSRDGGLTWTEPKPDPTLIEPVCQAALISVPSPVDPARRLLVFSNPASRRRVNMTVRLSRDDGKTWPAARPLWEGPSAYSALAALNDGRLACLYERGEKSPYETITLATFSLDWLTAPPPAAAAEPSDDSK